MFLYRILSVILFPFFKLYLNKRRKKGKEASDEVRFKERFGYASVERPVDKKVVWFHGASVGEVNSILSFADDFLIKYPSDAFVLITSNTVASAEMLSKKLNGKNNIIHQFVPIDDYFSVRRFLNHWKPDIGFFVDSDLWPNLLMMAKNRNVPLFLLNARITDKSYYSWLKLRWFIKKLLSAFKIIFAKSDDDMKKFSFLGGQKVLCFGNLKYSAEPFKYDQSEFDFMKSKISDRHIWLASSTHSGEDEFIIDSHIDVLKVYKDSLLILIPRHTNRLNEIIKSIERFDLKYAVRSKGEVISDDINVYVADTIGELGLFYSLSDIVFVGGSFVNIGGHNPIEPMQLKSIVITGPNYQNFQDMYDEMIEENIAFRVMNIRELSVLILRYMDDLNKVEKDNIINKAFDFVNDKAMVKEKICRELYDDLKRVFGK